MLNMFQVVLINDIVIQLFFVFFLYIKGIQTVTRAVISEGKGGKKLLLVEGYGLREVMTTEGKLIVNFI